MEEEVFRFDSDVLVLRDFGVAYAHSLQSDYDSRFNSSSSADDPTAQNRLLVHRPQ